MVSLAILMSCVATVAVGADDWFVDLALARERAAAEKKPLLVVFRCVP